ncbi:hypothetical protein AB6A40_006064 [Gnathostoma spinigerum]|uniref:legumain n=1 Tax=Gnathostoma spinigerum TaxID=75299 RepID=A0ABD6EH92_9BILA
MDIVQADACHAYHLLRDHGVPESRIIVMMYDDIAYNEDNPYPGKLFNVPHGKDVYAGVKIDYKGPEVNPENFLAILRGEKHKVKGGNGRVIESGPNDHIFVYFTDHGSSGLILFPSGSLTVKQLHGALVHMHQHKRYGQLVFYLEACESGSMFEKNLPPNMQVYAVTAANGNESSWGCFCENDMKLPCLGDLFSVNWILDSEVENLRSETLRKQYDIVKIKTNRSHVQRFGNISISDEHVSEFQGRKKSDKERYRKFGDRHSFGALWPSRDIYLLELKRQLSRIRFGDPHASAAAILEAKIAKIEEKRRYLRHFLHNFVETLVPDSGMANHIFQYHPSAISNLECHDKVVRAFNVHCFNLNTNPFVLNHIYILTNLCEHGIGESIIVNHILGKCSEIGLDGIH